MVRCIRTTGWLGAPLTFVRRRSVFHQKASMPMLQRRLEKRALLYSGGRNAVSYAAAFLPKLSRPPCLHRLSLSAATAAAAAANGERQLRF